jgi:hypothetical protein
MGILKYQITAYNEAGDQCCERRVSIATEHPETHRVTILIDGMDALFSWAVERGLQCETLGSHPALAAYHINVYPLARTAALNTKTAKFHTQYPTHLTRYFARLRAEGYMPDTLRKHTRVFLRGGVNKSNDDREWRYNGVVVAFPRDPMMNLFVGREYAYAKRTRDYSGLVRMYNTVINDPHVSTTVRRRLRERISSNWNSLTHSLHICSECGEMHAQPIDCNLPYVTQGSFCPVCVAAGRVVYCRYGRSWCSTRNAQPVRAMHNANADIIDYARSADYIPSTFIWVDDGPASRYWVHELNYQGNVSMTRTMRGRLAGQGSPLAYHHSRSHVGHIPSLYSNDTPRLLMGMELEVERGNTVKSQKIEAIREWAYSANVMVDSKPYLEIEQDGSLTDGFEMVTGYTGLDIHEIRIKELLKLTVGLRSHDTTTCGLHVHLDKAKISPFHAAKLIQFVHDPENRSFIVAIARRSPDECQRYAGLLDKKSIHKLIAATVNNQSGGNKALRNHPNVVAYATRNSTSRYEAINMTNTNTIEFRLFRGTLKLETIMSCLEFARISWLFARDTGRSQLDRQHFFEYLKKPEHRLETRYLRYRLWEAGFKDEFAGAKQEQKYTIQEIHAQRKVA